MEPVEEGRARGKVHAIGARDLLRSRDVIRHAVALDVVVHRAAAIGRPLAVLVHAHAATAAADLRTQRLGEGRARGEADPLEHQLLRHVVHVPVALDCECHCVAGQRRRLPTSVYARAGRRASSTSSAATAGRRSARVVAAVDHVLHAVALRLQSRLAKPSGVSKRRARTSTSTGVYRKAAVDGQLRSLRAQLIVMQARPTPET